MTERRSLYAAHIDAYRDRYHRERWSETATDADELWSDGLRLASALANLVAALSIPVRPGPGLTSLASTLLDADRAAQLEGERAAHAEIMEMLTDTSG